MKQRYDDIDEYIADLKMEIAANEQCANHHYNLGLALLSKRDFVGAEEALLNAVRNSPTWPRPMCSSAASAWNAATWKAACATTKKPPSAAPSSPCRGATSPSCTCSAASRTRPSPP